MYFNRRMDNEMWYTYTMEFYAAVKKNEIINFADKWIKLENIMLNEVTQTQKDKSHILSHLQFLLPNLQM